MRFCSAPDTARPRPRLMLTMLMFALPMLLGNWAMLVRYRVDLQWESHQAASHTLALMETMLSHAQEANRQALPFLGKPCADALPTLRSLVAMVPFVRSVNLGAGSRIYCTSQFGLREIPYAADAYSQGRLRLMEGNEVRRHHPVLSVRTDTAQGAVMTLIDGDYLNFMLSLNQRAMPLMLRVGECWLDEEGHFFAAEPPLVSQDHVRLQAAGYPLSIYAGYSSAPTLMGLWRHHGFGIWLLFAFSTCFAVIMWWLLGRPRSPISELARALRAKEFVPYLQPLVESGSERIMGVEVLMRWQHPDVGLIRPDLFIPQAEASGLIVPMTSLVMGAVAERLAAEQAGLSDGFHVGFNISAAHCRDDSLLEDCRSFLARFAPGKVILVLELTERELLVADPHTLSLFQALDEMGVKLAMDDFGTGHSSLVYLQQFHVDYLKIDQSFIARIGTESLSEHIVDNVIDLGHRLGLTLVAEGVETREQAEYLKGKVTYLQGYLFGRPAPIQQFCDEWLAEGQNADPVMELVGVT